MHVKRLCRPSVREALAAAREELGPSALVLSTELVPAPGFWGFLGRRVVQLTAATEADVSENRSPLPDRRPAEAPKPVKLDPVRAGMAARLAAAGIDARLASAVVGRLTPSECRGGADVALRKALAEELTAISSSADQYARIEVFVGPPGVGKTTTIAKIAAQERARAGRMLGLVGADAFRAGAIEQLRSYAAVLGVPFRIARNPEELAQALDASRQTALVDTAGRSAADSHLAGVAEVLSRARGVRTHLVLAADTSAAAARRIFDRYAAMQPSRVVITKIDESESIAPLLGIVRERALPVSYLGTGQRVPEDLWRATPAGLAAALLRESAMEDVTCH